MFSVTKIVKTGVFIARASMSLLGYELTRSRFVRESTFAELPESPDTLAATLTEETEPLSKNHLNKQIKHLRRAVSDVEASISTRDVLHGFVDAVEYEWRRDRETISAQEQQLQDLTTIYISSVDDRTRFQSELSNANQVIADLRKELRHAKSEESRIRRKAEDMRLMLTPPGIHLKSFYPYAVEGDGHEGEKINEAEIEGCD